ncbi:uncharacterized protein LOC141660977 [Apium graveolens]|uniref:uncharacterized protein LOC141660977 n=1 Tax=Apium graveolens TaxID=4045 RepID=UPI003D7BCE42
MDPIHRTVLGKIFFGLSPKSDRDGVFRVEEGDRSVTEYEAKFTELARIAPEYVSSEAQRAKQFQQGLKPEIMSGVVALQLKTFTWVVQDALVIESDQRLAAKEEGEKKRKFEGGPASYFYSDKVQQASDRLQDKQKEASGQCKENVNCFKCGQKGHYSTEFKSENQGVTYFSCGKMGHIARICKSVTQGSVGKSACQGPATSTAKARTFKMIKKSSAQDSDVVAGTLYLNSVSVNVLFDSGASKSFIFVNCVNKMQLMLEELDELFTIEVANKDKVHVSQFCPKCSIEISRHTFLANLIHFEFGVFDVILGIDWLSLYKVNIDCKKKTVVMYTIDNVRIRYQGQKQDKKFLSVPQVKKLLQQGCEAYLAHVVDPKKETPTFDEIPIVREYPDIFPEELPGLPPDREIEFFIDLIPGAEPGCSATSGLEERNALEVLEAGNRGCRSGSSLGSGYKTRMVDTRKFGCYNCDKVGQFSIKYRKSHKAKDKGKFYQKKDSGSSKKYPVKYYIDKGKSWDDTDDGEKQYGNLALMA